MRINEKHLIAFANSNAPIDREGYLYKRGEVNKAFQKRWFVMKGNLLFYFDKHGDREPIGVIILESCTVELGDNAEYYTFDLVFKGGGSRTYTLGAETQEDMETWMKTITCAGYEYMKLMVSELQRQLDDLNAMERSQKGFSVRSSNGEIAPLQNRSEMTKNILRQTISDENNLLVDLSDPQASKPVAKQEKRQGRINPFNDPPPDSNPNGSKARPLFNSYNPSTDLLGLSLYEDSAKARSSAPNLTERAMEVTVLDYRNFEKLHAEFGEFIKKKCNLKICDKPVL